MKKYFGPKHIFHLDSGGPLDIPAVDKGKDGDAEDGEQFDHLEIKDLVNAILISRLIQFMNPLTEVDFCQWCKFLQKQRDLQHK